jgi:hypothetical protein
LTLGFSILKISVEGLWFKPDNPTFDFIEISAQIINKNFLNLTKTKNNLIYAKIVQIL